MRAIENREKTDLTRSGKGIVIVKPSKKIFKIVVNNYNQPIENPVDERNEDNEEPGAEGLPPQPSGYLRFPAYDWF